MKKFTGTVQTTLAVPTPATPVAGPPVPEIATQSVTNVLPTLKKSNGSPLLTYDQAVALSSLKFSTGEQILGLNNRYFVYEVVNMLNSLDYEVVYNFLSADWAKVFGNVHDLRKKIILENPLLEPSREKLQLDMEIFRNRVDVVKGAIDCKKCGSEETISVEKQIRSADEPMTIKVTCLQCGFKWTAQ
jgi:DNA-directed RNA polymerase subunit M/transcription elongation factor TFIIS